MIAVDTNLLVYALREDSPHHIPSLAALTDLASSGNSWGIPWPCVHEFIAVSTHPRIYVPSTPPNIAFGAMDVWVFSPHCRLIGEGPGYYEHLKELAKSGMVSGPMIHHARIAAVCLHHGVRELWTMDRDFSRFPNFGPGTPCAE